MRILNLATAALLAMGASQALAQAPSNGASSGPNTASGARPGHEIGVGNSLPMSSKASNIEASDTHSAIAPTLPQPRIGANSDSRDYLKSARASVMHGQTGRAQQALEMAETRELDRSVAPDQTAVPSNNQMIARISDARRALGHGDRAKTIQMIDLALAG